MFPFGDVNGETSMAVGYCSDAVVQYTKADIFNLFSVFIDNLSLYVNI